MTDYMPRLDIDDYFLKIAAVVAERSTCLRHHVGAVAVRDKKIIATGYNGAPPKFPHCIDAGCLRDNMGIPSGKQIEICRAIHAEANLVIQAANGLNSLADSTIYCTHTPCNSCAKLLVGAGISRYVTYGLYSDTGYVDIFGMANVVLDSFKHRPSITINTRP